MLKVNKAIFSLYLTSNRSLKIILEVRNRYILKQVKYFKIEIKNLYKAVLSV